MKKQFDQYFNNGFYEILQEGNTASIKNLLSPETHEKMIIELANKAPAMKEKIEDLIQEIKSDVLKCSPLDLLSGLQMVFLHSMMGITSESQLLGMEIFASQHAVEYVQSIFASSPVGVESKKSVDISILYPQIISKIEQLYSLIVQYYFSVGADYLVNAENAYIDEIIQSQHMYLVRGKRFQVFESEYFKDLLIPHDSIFRATFGMSATDILHGIECLQYSLSQGRIEPMFELHRQFSELKKIDPNKVEEHLTFQQDKSKDLIEKLFGYALNDVIKITGWTREFVKALSFSLGEDDSFFKNKDYPGWPIIDLPIQKRPFIEIDNQFYCFDYYSFSDNFYRAIQKMLSKKVPNYNWNSIQNEASEEMVARIFQKLLPGCSIMQDNYYPKNNSLKQMCENDLLIQYCDTLFIIEVKAGSFVYTAPLVDFDAHIVSYKKLIEEPDNQCKRTFDYLASQDRVVIYSEDKTIKGEISISSFSDVFAFSVTVDNINVFAAKAEKLGFINLGIDAISIGIDYLMVYEHYFDSPLKFLHYLKQRRIATHNKIIAPDDELDHLGMYIAHNCYSMEYKDEKNTHLQLFGYREQLDTYFGQLYHAELSPEKPRQDLPDLFETIISFLDHAELPNKIRISNFLLDFSSEAKAMLNDSIYHALIRQKEIGRSVAYSSSNPGADGLRYVCFVQQEGIQNLSQAEREEYTLSTMLWNEEDDRSLICISFNKDEEITDIQYKLYCKDNIPEPMRESLFIKGKERAQKRIEIYKMNHGNKIGRNDKCPCGSGKKYKHCCGRI